MRLAFAACCLCLFSVLCAVPLASSQTAAPPTTTAAILEPIAAPPASDAAEKHAKRTACLKQAKTKKLLGADKTEFLKNCNAAP